MLLPPYLLAPRSSILSSFIPRSFRHLELSGISSSYHVTYCLPPLILRVPASDERPIPPRTARQISGEKVEEGREEERGEDTRGEERRRGERRGNCVEKV